MHCVFPVNCISLSLSSVLLLINNAFNSLYFGYITSDNNTFTGLAGYTENNEGSGAVDLQLHRLPGMKI